MRRLFAPLVLAALSLAGCSPPTSAGPFDLGDLGQAPTVSTDMAWARWPAGPAPLSVQIPTVMTQPGQEVSDFYSAVLPNDAPLWIQKVGWVASEGLHHSQVSIGNNPLGFSLAVGQTNGVEEFPLGYAMSLRAKQPLLIAYHFVNAATTARPGNVEVQFFPVADANTVTPKPISLVPFIYMPIHIPPHATKEIQATCVLPRDVEVHGMLSHIHRLGRHVQASVVGGANDGRVLYSTDLWDNAPIDQFHPPIQLAKGDAIRFSCKWQNDTDAEVGWGTRSSQEMCGVAAWMSPVDNDLFATVTTEGGPCELATQ